MIEKVKEIGTGWFNVARKELNLSNPIIEEKAERRLKSCAFCPVRSGHKCDSEKSDIHVKSGVHQFGFGCHLIAKTRSPSSFCPLGNW